MQWLALAVLLWLASAVQPAGAQSPKPPQPSEAAGGAANLVPLASAALALKAQSVELTYLPEQHAWAVAAHFEVANLGDRPLSAQLAIPEFACDPEGEFDDNCDPSRPGFAQLSAALRGRVLRLHKARPGRNAEAETAPEWIWDFPLQLAVNETVPIDLQYAVPAGASNEGGWSASYRMRGGMSWAKPIGRATFKFGIPAYSCLVIEPEKLQRKSRRVVLRDGEPWLELVLEAYVWNPPPAIGLYFEPCAIARDTQMPACPAASALQRYFFPAGPEEEVDPISEPQLREALAKLDSRQLERCQKAVFEAYAGYYSPAELKRLPSNADDRHYTAPLLTAADWKWVHYLDARLAERPASTPPPAAAAPAAARQGCGCRIAQRAGSRPAAIAGLGLVIGWTLRSRSSRARSRASSRS